jgi:transcriptional regulator with XRE-family HTH domain
VNSEDGSGWGDLLRTTRMRSGISQRALARRMACSPSSIVRIEQGQHQLLEKTVKRYAAALGLRPELHLVPIEEAPCPTT